MVHVKILLGMALMLAAWLLPAVAQVPVAPKSPPFFSLLNLIRSPQPATIKIGPEPISEEPIPHGFYAVSVPWPPSLPLSVEVPGFPTLRIPFTPISGNQRPLIIIQDGMEKPPGGGEAQPVLKFISISNAKDRPPNFLDGLNLSSRETLTGDLGNKAFSLEKGKRTRIATTNGFNLKIQDGPEVSVSASDGSLGLLIVFYENLQGKIEFVITNDILISP